MDACLEQCGTADKEGVYRKITKRAGFGETGLINSNNITSAQVL
jgi:hypothetical protein